MKRWLLVVAFLLLCCVAPAFAQNAAPAVPDGNAVPSALEDSIEQQMNDLAPPIRMALLISVLVFLPSLLLTVTCYTRIIIVLSFVRRAIGTTELPPNPVLVGIALFLTAGVMSPTFSRVYDKALGPLLEQKIGAVDALSVSSTELKTFLLEQTREEDLLFALDLSQAARPETEADMPLSVAVPAFVLSELRTAFRMGFLIFLPFVLIDLIVASVLLSLGMFMLPPTIIATPLKILLFVLVDGWALVVHSLALSFTPT
jgi:flagellar biosynthetic protein FliP